VPVGEAVPIFRIIGLYHEVTQSRRRVLKYSVWRVRYNETEKNV